MAVSQEVSHQNYGRISFPASHLTCDPYQSHSSAPHIILFTYHMCCHKHTSFSPEKFPKNHLARQKFCDVITVNPGSEMAKLFLFWYNMRSDCAHSRHDRKPNNVQLFIKGMLLPVK
jgi:hypothetical protein